MHKPCDNNICYFCLPAISNVPSNLIYEYRDTFLILTQFKTEVQGNGHDHFTERKNLIRKLTQNKVRNQMRCAVG